MISIYALRTCFLLLLLAVSAVLTMAYLFVASLTDGTVNVASFPVWSVLFALATAILLGSWWLDRASRPGLACLLLTLGLPGSFVGFVFLLFVVNPGPHH